MNNATQSIRWPEFVAPGFLVLLETGITVEVHKFGRVLRACGAGYRVVRAEAIPYGAALCDWCFPDGLVVDHGAVTRLAWLGVDE